MFDKKPLANKRQPFDISFVPEEIVRVLSDVVVRVPVSNSDYSKFMDLVSKYQHKVPKIKVIVKSEAGDTVELTNFQLFFNDINQGAKYEKEAV